MNWLLIGFIVLTLYRVIDAGHRGIVKEVLILISLLFMSIFIPILMVGVNAYFNEDILKMVGAIIICIIILAIHSMIKLVLLPARILAKIPIVNWLNKALGLLAGLAEGVFVLWAVLYAIDFGMLAEYTEVMKPMVAESEILTWFTERNMITPIVIYIEGIINAVVKI